MLCVTSKIPFHILVIYFLKFLCEQTQTTQTAKVGTYSWSVFFFSGLCSGANLSISLWKAHSAGKKNMKDRRIFIWSESDKKITG